MKLNSDFRRLCGLTGMPFSSRQEYMIAIDLGDPRMPHEYSDYDSIVRGLCKCAGANKGEAYVTIDEKLVEAGMSQRRPKPHVDGCFIPKYQTWGHGSGGWSHSSSGWSHSGWNHASKIPRMSVIVASSVAGCKAWKGEFEAEPKSDGDLSHIEENLGPGYILEPNCGYLLSPDCIHESMVFLEPVHRTFLRIALPVDYRYASVHEESQSRLG